MRKVFVSLTLVLTLILTLVLTACAAPDLDRDPWCQLGTGDVEFVPLTNGDEVDVVGGIQGGDHIWGSARVTGLDWRDVTLVFELLDEDGILVTPSSTLIGELPHCTQSDDACEAGMGETVGFPVIVQRVSDVVGDDITMTVTASDREGRTAAHSIVVDPIRSLD